MKTKDSVEAREVQEKKQNKHERGGDTDKTEEAKVEVEDKVW